MHPRWRMRLTPHRARLARWPCLLTGVFLMAAAVGAAQEGAPRARLFLLSSRAHITLTAGWMARPDAELPPAPVLAASAPRFAFSDFSVLENREALSVLELGFSNNPFIGADARQVDIEIHASLVGDLFYFFFPPPRGCLARARTAFEDERRRAEEEQREQSEKKDKDKESPPRRRVAISQACIFGQTPAEFYAGQISRGVGFRETGQGDRVDGQWLNFYSPSMEEVETEGETFFVFAARAEHALDQTDIEKFGLPDDRVGARAYFFWAIGAANPFPFMRDPERKNLELLHVVYACLTLDDDAGAAFRRYLKRVRIEP